MSMVLDNQVGSDKESANDFLSIITHIVSKHSRNRIETKNCRSRKALYYYYRSRMKRRGREITRMKRLQRKKHIDSTVSYRGRATETAKLD